MKKVAMIMLTLLTAALGYGQQTEFSAHLNSGLFSFRGESASRYSHFNLSDIVGEPAYTNNPYGKKSGLSYGIGVQVKRVTDSKLFFGFQPSFESLSSKIDIEYALGDTRVEFEKGKTIFNHKFINLYPFIGKRYHFIDVIRTDISIGFDFGFCLSAKEKGKGTTDTGEKITTSTERTYPSRDLRPRIELVNHYRNYALSIGYAWGFSNYTNEYVGADIVSKSRYFRIGFSYKIFEL